MQRRRPAYQVEPTWLREDIWSRGHVEPWELLQICAWKSANANLALLSLNQPKSIVSVTSDVLTYLNPYMGVDARDLRMDEVAWADVRAATDLALGTTTGLRSIHGVRLPVGSAVLAILNPALWPVVDRWALAGTFDPPPSLWHQGKFASYWRYLRRLADLQQAHGRDENIHQLDQLIYRDAMDGRPPRFRQVPFQDIG